MFSDESNFQVFRMGSTTVRCPRSSDCFDPWYMIPTVKHPKSCGGEVFLVTKEGEDFTFFQQTKKQMPLCEGFEGAFAQLLLHSWL